MESFEWSSPPDLVEAGRVVLGGFDLDPASCQVSNGVIRATDFFDEAEDGLSKPWVGRVWLNPPSPPKPWWRKLVAEHQAGNLRSAIFVGYSIEVLQNSQLWDTTPMLAFPICVPKRRVSFLCTAADKIVALQKKWVRRFEKSGGVQTRAELAQLEKLQTMPRDALVPGDQPTHSSVIVGVGVDIVSFRDAFRHVGWTTGGSPKASAPKRPSARKTVTPDPRQIDLLPT